MFNFWYTYVFEDGYTTVAKKLSYKEYSMLTHAHGKIVRKERYKNKD